MSRHAAALAAEAGGTGWRTSSHSNAEGGNCVEVARVFSGAGVVPVRDSKCPDRPALRFGAGAWSSFLDALKSPARPPAF